jgi:hypothetical protein
LTANNSFIEANGLNEYRMLNTEFRMMKFNFFYLLLRRSLFVIRPARYALKQIWDRSAMPMSVGATLAPQSTFAGQAGILRFAFELLRK